MEHPNRAPRTRRGPAERAPRAALRRPPRAEDELGVDADHDADVYDPLEHDTESDGDDEHAPQHAMVHASSRRRRAPRR